LFEGNRRGDKQNIMKKSFSKANNISRSSLLQYKEKQKCKRTHEANSPDSKSLTVWYALSHMRRMTAARQKVLIGVGRFGV
jgi:hypothetical protein